MDAIVRFLRYHLLGAHFALLELPQPWDRGASAANSSQPAQVAALAAAIANQRLRCVWRVPPPLRSPSACAVSYRPEEEAACSPLLPRPCSPTLARCPVAVLSPLPWSAHYLSTPYRSKFAKFARCVPAFFVCLLFCRELAGNVEGLHFVGGTARAGIQTQAASALQLREGGKSTYGRLGSSCWVPELEVLASRAYARPNPPGSSVPRGWWWQTHLRILSQVAAADAGEVRVLGLGHCRVVGHLGACRRHQALPCCGCCAPLLCKSWGCMHLMRGVRTAGVRWMCRTAGKSAAGSHAGSKYRFKHKNSNGSSLGATWSSPCVAAGLGRGAVWRLDHRETYRHLAQRVRAYKLHYIAQI